MSMPADVDADPYWVPQHDASEAIRRIDETLELISEATASISAIAPLGRRELSIILPVYNELKTLPVVLDRIEQTLALDAEVIIVDDGSTDGTSEWLDGLPPHPDRRVIHRRVNHGKGSSIRLAVRHACGSVIAIQDADLEYDPVDLAQIVRPILEGESKAVYGSRYLRRNTDSAWHRAGNWLLTKTSNVFTGLQLSDMETCHKAFEGDLLRSIPLQECRFGFEPEITAKIASRVAHVREVSTQYKSRGYDAGKKIGWRDAIATLVCIWKYRRG
ncbi:MAG: glycosyltransferase family 2 protein [Rubripirellula sp.]